MVVVCSTVVETPGSRYIYVRAAITPVLPELIEKVRPCENMIVPLVHAMVVALVTEKVRL